MQTALLTPDQILLPLLATLPLAQRVELLQLTGPAEAALHSPPQLLIEEVVLHQPVLLLLGSPKRADANLALPWHTFKILIITDNAFLRHVVTIKN